MQMQHRMSGGSDGSGVAAAPPLTEHVALLPYTAKHRFSQFEANQNKTKKKKKKAESVQECSNRQKTVKK
jgi:hypothetical protein